MENKKLLAFITFGTLFGMVVGNECLISSHIQPCTIHKHDSRIHMICPNIKDVPTLLRILNEIKGCPIFALQFLRLKLDSLPRGAFDGTLINSLIFTNCSLMNLADDGPGPSPFLGLEKQLHTFGVSGAKTPLKWNWKELANLYSLETLSFARSNNLSTVPDTFFKINGSSLKKLAITGSCLTEIQDSAFANFHKVESINLEGNNLYRIRREVFPARCERLRLLSLRNNFLSVLDGNTFSNMPALKTLYLEGNRIKFIEQNVFSNIWNQLNTLSLYRNSIVCNCKIAWLIGKKRIYEVSEESLVCSNPAHLNGMPIKYLERNDLCSNINDRCC
ncbi:leucine-rich repeat and immunoglobulin-like domain-containing nogo receptor-interacting protein 3 [Centruroides sculpturatus]|uniref:leucine-rich repeat and immunoglobulin-like domain-containing nogo receptor-interacting protein 3 n=1 Tax=Centruroides sculpturatus TaxID=218467 RepID=UPI000C6CF5C6|nr:leucine-rich repeat and immunoglobulin-like domain-containing nogo receptor-interacting protein 3 [Centruroides sculpturatus]